MRLTTRDNIFCVAEGSRVKASKQGKYYWFRTAQPVEKYNKGYNEWLCHAAANRVREKLGLPMPTDPLEV